MLPNNRNEQSEIKPNVSIPDTRLLSRPIIQAKFLEKITTFEIELVDGLKGTFSDKINRAEIRPLEYTASILLYNKDSGKGPLIPISSITNIGIVSQKKGHIVKKDDKMIEISFTDFQSKPNTVRINMEDKLIDEFLNAIDIVRTQLQSGLYDALGISHDPDSDQNSQVIFYPMLPYLFDGEELVWYYIFTKGILNKKATWLNLVTNYRILEYNFFEHSGNYTTISGVEDVIVNNQRRVSDSTGYGSYGKSRYNISGVRSGKTTSKTIGDVVVIANGKPFITFNGVSDPHGLSKLIKSLKKQWSYSLFNVSSTPAIENNNQIVKPDSTHEEVIDNKDKYLNTSETDGEIICIHCNKKNYPNSKFCSYCGQKVLIPLVCSACNQINASDASFCNQCGTRL